MENLDLGRGERLDHLNHFLEMKIPKTPERRKLNCFCFATTQIEKVSLKEKNLHLEKRYGPDKTPRHFKN